MRLFTWHTNVAYQKTCYAPPICTRGGSVGWSKQVRWRCSSPERLQRPFEFKFCSPVHLLSHTTMLWSQYEKYSWLAEPIVIWNCLFFSRIRRRAVYHFNIDWPRFCLPNGPSHIRNKTSNRSTEQIRKSNLIFCIGRPYWFLSRSLHLSGLILPNLVLNATYNRFIYTIVLEPLQTMMDLVIPLVV